MGYADIVHWLNGKGGYAAGVALFRAHGNNTTLLNLFCQTENSFTREELRLALQEIVDSASGKEIPLIPVSKAHPVFSASEDFEAFSESVWYKIDVSKLPPELKKLWNKKGAITEEQKSLFYRLELFPTDADRLKANLRILDIEDERQAMWQIFNKWHETGVYDQVKEPTLPEMEKMVLNLTVRISKLKKRTNKQTLREELILEREKLKVKIKDVALQGK